MSGFTPGPWVVRTKTCVGGPAPCVDYDHGSVGGQIASLALCDNAENNALLIAAAPDMLAASTEAEWFLAHYADYVASVPVDEIERHPYLPDLQAKLEMLRAALAKATGQSVVQSDNGGGDHG